jgi:hypothetical protein
VIAKAMKFFGQDVVLVCDECCDMAFGISDRPKIGETPDGAFDMVPDSEIEKKAPKDPGSTEGADSKPRNKAERLNKWCARACERSVIIKPHETFKYGSYGLENSK